MIAERLPCQLRGSFVVECRVLSSAAPRGLSAAWSNGNGRIPGIDPNLAPLSRGVPGKFLALPEPVSLSAVQSEGNPAHAVPLTWLIRTLSLASLGLFACRFRRSRTPSGVGLHELFRLPERTVGL
jgi:hypothetical protein